MMNESQSRLFLPAGYEFHHLGYASACLTKERDFFALLGYVQEGEAFIDPVQGISGCFLTGPGPRIELLENLPGSRTLTPWLEAGIKLYHFAYLVADLDAALAWSSQQRSRVIVSPAPAVAFGGRRISFIMFRNHLMLEFIENNQ